MGLISDIKQAINPKSHDEQIADLEREIELKKKKAELARIEREIRQTRDDKPSFSEKVGSWWDELPSEPPRDYFERGPFGDKKRVWK